jgi:hypothetical protein
LTDPDDPPGSITWREPSLILAMLIVNLLIWVNFESILAAILESIFFAALFLGPALAAHRGKQSLFDAASQSLGWFPGWIFRLACCAICIALAAVMLDVIGTATQAITSLDWTRSSGPLARFAFLCAMLCLCPVQSLRGEARLARISIHVAIAALIAVVLRLRGGFHEAIPLFFHDAISPHAVVFGPTYLVPVILGPLAVLAAGPASRARTRRDIHNTALAGILLPIVAMTLATILIASLIHVLRSNSLRDIPSALMWQASPRLALRNLLILALAALGSLRFAVTRLWEFSQFPQKWLHRAAFFALLAIAVLIADRWLDAETLFRFPAPILICTSAVISAGLFFPRGKTPSPVNWPGLFALTAGVLFRPVAHIWIHQNPDAMPDDFLFPSFAVSFLIALLARYVESKNPTPIETPTEPRL